MAALILDDPGQQVGEHRVLRLADQGAVTGEGRQLVDGADGEVDRREVLGQPGPGHRGQDAEAVLDAEVRADAGDPVLRVELDAVQVEKLAQVLAVPQLFVVPAGEEGRQDRVHARPGHEQVRQVQRDVVLDVHHVVEREQVSLGQRIPGHVFPGHPCDVQLL